MAMLKPERLNMGTSVGWSPMVAISCERNAEVARQEVRPPRPCSASLFVTSR